MRQKRKVPDIRVLRAIADGEQQVLVGATLPRLSRTCRVTITPIVARLRRYRKAGWVRPVFAGYVLTPQGRDHLAHLENGRAKT